MHTVYCTVLHTINVASANYFQECMVMDVPTQADSSPFSHTGRTEHSASFSQNYYLVEEEEEEKEGEGEGGWG